MAYFGGDRRKSQRRDESNRRSKVRRLLDSRGLLNRRLNERPEEDRRQLERRDDERRAGERRGHERRDAQRREFFRVVYPPTNSPEVLDTNYHVLDISCKGIKFYCSDENGQCKPPVRISQPLTLKIRFEDKEVVEIQGRILRCYLDQDINAKVYCAMLTQGPTPKRIHDEQSYLLKHFPDFYRQQED